MEQYDLIYIDDEPSMIVIFQQVIQLKYSHWRAIGLSDSQELYDRIVSKNISANVWIIDLMMPNKNGIEIAQAIRDAGDDHAMLLGYTALDTQTLSRSPEYNEGVHLFTRIIGKQEGFLKLLAGLNGNVLRSMKA